jgi:hypothetical protein
MLALLLVAGSATPAAAVNNSTIDTVAPYYDNVSDDVDNESWLRGIETPSIENATTLLTRLGSFVVGTKTGSAADEAAGALMVGLIVVGVTLGLVGPSQVGFVAGSVAGSVTIAALVIGGLAPEWLWAVVLFLIGTVAATVFYRVTR